MKAILPMRDALQIAALPPAMALGFLMFVAMGRVAGAEVGSRFYFTADLGASFIQDTKVKSSDPFIQSGKVQFDPGAQLDVKIGYNVTDWLAAELETGIRVNPTGSIENELGSNDFLYYQVPILVNLLYQVPTRSRFRPFVGAGIGGVATSLESTDWLYGTSDDASGLGWQGILGARYQ